MPEIEDQAASNAASAVKAQKSPKKGGNAGVFNPVYGYVALALGVLSLAGAGYGIVENMNTSNNLKTVYKSLNEKIATVQQADPKELAISDETMMTITQKVRQDVDATLPESVQSAAKTYVAQVRNDLMVQVDRKIRDIPLPSADVDPALVNALVIQALKSQSSALNKDEQARREVAELRTTVEGISAQLASGTVAKAQPVVERVRLKGFNIVGEPLKNNTLFVVDAPKKDGSTASNSITLVKGEGFLNKWLGSQRVEGIEKQQDGKYRLLISGGYFIDSNREEYTKEELLALKPAPKKQAQKKRLNKNRLSKRPV
ncbi:hypothetical protein [Vibrio sp. Hal054]|uniref:hypothetical protein n=1 Tax=Vibrio sp. Hal054 TaxID=3035158 RepID=UPI00301D4558